MKRTVVFIIFLMIFLSGCLANDTSSEPFDAINGSLDLRHIDVQSTLPVPLNGEWNFYWGEQLTLDQFSTQPAHTIELPRLWNNYELDGNPLSSFGYATYHLRILLNTSDIGKTKAIYIPFIHTSYTLYIDNQHQGGNGMVGTSKETTQPQYLPQVFYFTPLNETVDVILHVSNFDHSKGGINKEILFGSAHNLSVFKQNAVAHNLFLLGCFLIIAIYHLLIFLYRKSEIASLIFALFSLFIALRLLVIDQIFLTHLFPNFNWEWQISFEYLTVFGGLLMFSVFLRKLYPNETNASIYRIILAVTGFYSLTVIFLSPYMFTKWFSSFTPFALLLVIYFSYVMVLAAIRKREGAIISCLAGIYFYFTIAHDFLYNIGILSTSGYLVPNGFLIFILSQSIILSIKYAKTFQKVAFLNIQLRQLNESLEEKIQERTKTLQDTMRETASAIAEKSMYEERNRLVREIHDTVGHTLTSIIVQIEAGKRLITKNPQTSIEKLEASQQQVRSGLDEIRRILKILKRNEPTDGFEDFLQQLILKTTLNTDITIQSNIQIKKPLSSQIQHVIYRALQEGLTNGIRHGNSDFFQFELYETDTEVVFVLTDNGRGAEEFEYGLGLTAMKERIDELHGNLLIDTNVNQGFTVRFSISLKEWD